MHARKHICIIMLLAAAFALCAYAAPADEEAFSVAIMGCMHMGLSDPQRYEAAVRKINAAGPDFVIFLGAMVDPSGNKKTVEELWREFDRITAGLETPVYNVPDSCRLMPLELPEETRERMNRAFLERYGKRYGAFKYKNNLFILLDSDNLLEGSANRRAVNEQISFLKRLTQDPAEYACAFVFLNRSFWLESEEIRSRWLHTIHPILRDRVRFVFASNGHCWDMSYIDDIAYLTNGHPPYDGPAGASHGRSPESFLNFALLTVAGNTPHVTVHPIEPLPAAAIQQHLEAPFKDLIRIKHLKDFALTSTERERILPVAQVIEALGITPGMTIADIGAGAGFFTFPIARQLKGSGAVIATDVDPAMIEYMRARSGTDPLYGTISPQLVRPGLPDKTYAGRRFDKVFVSETYHCLHDPKEYFRRLKPAIKKNGRVYIIHFRNTPDFSGFEFGDFSRVLTVLRANDGRYPILMRLPEDTKRFIQDTGGLAVPARIRAGIMAGFNRMIDDRFLWNDLLDYYAGRDNSKAMEWGWPLLKKVDPSFRRLAQWLVITLHANGVFDPEKKDIVHQDRKHVRYLNRILLTGIFHTEILDYLQGHLPIYLDKDNIIKTFDEAGYEIVREHDFLPYHHFLEFAPRPE